MPPTVDPDPSKLTSCLQRLAAGGHPRGPAQPRRATFGGTCRSSFAGGGTRLPRHRSGDGDIVPGRVLEGLDVLPDELRGFLVAAANAPDFVHHVAFSLGIEV